MNRKRPPGPDQHDDEELPPSKSQLKREARELFELGRDLSELPEKVLLALPLEDRVLQAVQFTRSMRSNVARKRQLGFLAKLLRAADVAPVLEALEARQSAARSLNARHHRAEAWRDLLLAGGNAPLELLLAQRQDVDVPALRQLVRNAQAEARRDKPPASARKLFRMLRDLDETATLPALPANTA